MECERPPQLTDGQLLAYIDGDDVPSVSAHLAQCPACRERGAQLGRLIGRMTVALYRLDCPTSTELGEYQLGMLPGSQQGAIAVHLGECPHCRAEVVQLQDFLADTARDLEPSIAGRARVLIARLLGGGSVGPGLSLGLAGVRGGDAPQVFEVDDDLQITLSVEASGQDVRRQSLFGLVLGAELTDARARLWRDQHLVGEATIDDLGNFVIADLESADYELVITAPDLEIHVPGVRI